MNSCTFIKSTLEKVCSLVTDGTHDTPQPLPRGYPLIKAKEIVGGKIDFENCAFISEKEHQKVIARSKPEKGDTLFAHIGASLGEAAYVNTTLEFSIKNIALFKPNPHVIFGRYLYYLTTSPQFQSLAKNTRTGSAQPFLSLGHLRNHPIRFHRKMEDQANIAFILSAYDDQIENNQRRIKILEDMAQSLYREWFVKFRFPGHKKVQMVDSPLGKIPDGWEVGSIGDICQVVTGFAFKSKDWSENGIPVIKIKNIRPGNLVETKQVDHVPEDIIEQKHEKYYLKNGDFLIAMTGATAGKVGKLRTSKQMALNQRVAKIEPTDGFYQYVWCRISNPEAEKEFYRLADGAAQPNMSSSQIEGVSLLIPSSEVRGQFAMIVSPILQQVDNLIFQKHHPPPNPRPSPTQTDFR